MSESKLEYSNIIIIIGLPGSGKTTLANSLATTQDIIIDDFLTDHFPQELPGKLKPNTTLIINDPRLCLYSIFTHFFDILISYLKPLKINLIFFENEPKLCMINIQSYINIKPNIINTIKSYSEKYNAENLLEYAKKKITITTQILTHEIIQVYKK